MAGVRETIKEHYNQHVAEGVSTKQALKQRREGPAAPLKRFHNDIKRRLIYRFAYKAEALLDYACGRGGDLQKWKSAQVQYVKGLDLSPKEVEEAHRRYGELLQKDPGCRLQATFAQTDSLGLSVVQEDRQYDVITCMFALHYFFEKEGSFMTLMETVAANLKPGGYFIGTVPDGKRVKANLIAHNGHLVQEHLILKQVWQGKESPFGSAYIMEIPDTVVEGHEGLTEGSHEYLVFEKVLLSVAKKHGLHPVLNFDDPTVDSLFEEGDAGKPMKHFNPKYPPDTDSSLALASKIYMAFVLQKVGSPEAVRAPALPPPERAPGGYQQQRQQQQQRPQRSPTREERFATLDGYSSEAAAAAAGGSRPPPAPQQQPQDGGGWRGAGRRGNKNSNWELPYQARILPPHELPSAFMNGKPATLAAREGKGRFVIKVPDMPFAAGPVQYDLTGHPICMQLPDGTWINSYYDELNYHAQQQQQQGIMPGGFGLPAAAAPMGMGHPGSGYGMGGGGWHDGGPGAAGGRGPGHNPHQQQRQQQQPQQQQPAYPGPPKEPQQQQQEQQHEPADAGGASTAAAAAEEEEGSGGGGTTGRGRGRGRGRKAAAAAADGEAGADAVASPARGRGGRGSRGGRVAGGKRARESSDAGAAAAAAADAGGEDGAAAAVGEGEEHAKRQAVQGGGGGRRAAGGAGGGGRGAGGGGRVPQPDPLGYKAATPAELQPELIESLAAMGPTYAAP